VRSGFEVEVFSGADSAFYAYLSWDTVCLESIQLHANFKKIFSI